MDTRTGEIFHLPPGAEKENMEAALSNELRRNVKLVEMHRPLTIREIARHRVDPYSPCACGSGKKFKWCCKTK